MVNQGELLHADANGVTNYSNQPPSDSRSVKNLKTVEDKLSVYSPDPGLVQAVEDARQSAQRREPLHVEVVTRLVEDLDAHRGPGFWAAGREACSGRAS